MSDSSSSSRSSKSRHRQQQQRYRQRLNQGQAIRHRASSPERAILLNIPTDELDRNARRRQRRYQEQLESMNRLQAQQQAHAVAQQFSATSSLTTPFVPQPHQYQQTASAVLPPLHSNMGPTINTSLFSSSFIPVAMVPSSLFMSMFTQLQQQQQQQFTSPSFPLQPSPLMGPAVPQQTQPALAPPSIMMSSEGESNPTTPRQPSTPISTGLSSPANILVDMTWNHARVPISTAPLPTNEPPTTPLISPLHSSTAPVVTPANTPMVAPTAALVAVPVVAPVTASVPVPVTAAATPTPATSVPIPTFVPPSPLSTVGAIDEDKYDHETPGNPGGDDGDTGCEEGKQPYMVHPPDHAKNETIKSWDTGNDAKDHPYSGSQLFKSDSYADKLVNLVLVPNRRISHVYHIRDNSRGMYLGVWNTDIKEDDSNVFNDIINNLPTSSPPPASSSSTTSSTSSKSIDITAPPLIVKQTTIPINEKGLFANRDYKADEFIVEYTGDIITEAEKKARYPNNDAKYLMYVKKDMYIDARDATISSSARYINTGGKYNNCNAVPAHGHGKSIININATEPIKKGQELFMPYGSGYHTLSFIEPQPLSQAQPQQDVSIQAAHLKRILPTQLTTYTQHLYHQELISSNKDKYHPIFKTTTYRRSGVKEAYVNLIHASNQATDYLQDNDKECISNTTATATFAPFVSTDNILLPHLRAHLRNIALQAQRHYQR